MKDCPLPARRDVSRVKLKRFPLWSRRLPAQIAAYLFSDSYGLRWLCRNRREELETLLATADEVIQ
jgi:hypothetical protein